MVCPRCGKESSNAKFCPECGQDLYTKTSDQSFEERRKALQKSGQAFCPSCLSTNYTADKWNNSSAYYHRSALATIVHFGASIWMSAVERKNGVQCVCLQCGERWWPKLERLHERHKKCVAKLLENYSAIKYPGVDGSYITLTEDRVVVSNPGKEDCIIPYNTIAVVDYRESKGLLYGRLTIRDKRHRRKRPPKTLDAVKNDKATVVYEAGYKSGYQQIFSALKAIAEENKKAGLL